MALQLLYGDQAEARPLPTHRITQTQIKHTQTSMPRAGFKPHALSLRVGKDGLCIRLLDYYDRRYLPFIYHNLYVETVLHTLYSNF
jgi:hypothetical protein